MAEKYDDNDACNDNYDRDDGNYDDDNDNYDDDNDKITKNTNIVPFRQCSKVNVLSLTFVNFCSTAEGYK